MLVIEGKVYCKITTSQLVLNFTAHKSDEISLNFPALYSFFGNLILDLVTHKV